MNISEFIDKFYMNKDYQEQVISDLHIKKSSYSENELLEHNEILNNFHYEILLNRISNEIYPKIKKINIEELII